MANDMTTIQSLKAVDSWIDVINANINGGVRTAFKSSRLRFAGSNTYLDRPATTSTLPLQFPEASLVTANTVIDFTQGAVTSSTETSHLAIQGNGFFLLASPDMINLTNGAGSQVYGTLRTGVTTGRFLITRDGEFHTNAHGFMVNSAGYYLVTVDTSVVGGRTVLNASQTVGGAASGIRAVFNNLDSPQGARDSAGATNSAGGYVNLTDFLNNLTGAANWPPTNGAAAWAAGTEPQALLKLNQGLQNVKYTQFGSTVYDFGYSHEATAPTANQIDSNISIDVATNSDATILSKSLEASNSSMTQSVPELSLAQKLFSALTKVIQIHQTNTDSVINLIR